MCCFVWIITRFFFCFFRLHLFCCMTQFAKCTDKKKGRTGLPVYINKIFINVHLIASEHGKCEKKLKFETQRRLYVSQSVILRVILLFLLLLFPFNITWMNVHVKQMSFACHELCGSLIFISYIFSSFLHRCHYRFHINYEISTRAKVFGSMKFIR